MHYFIDGYNLMFRMQATGMTLQSEREKFISDLYEKIQIAELNATLVFDAQHQIGLGSRSHINLLEICFTDEGETADDYIINELHASPNPREEIVITSDNILAWRARRLHAKTESAETFMRWLDHRYRKKKKNRTSPLPVSTPPVIPQELINPPPAQIDDPTLDRYLQIFEKKMEELPPADIKRAKKIEKTQNNEKEEDRWLRLFEERFNDKDA
jgi:uncharacterized protein